MTQPGGFSDPTRCARHERDAVFRCHKGVDSSAAIKEQQLSRIQSASQFAKQMELADRQLAQAQSIKPVTFAPAAPLTTGGQDAYYAGLDAKRAAKRRFGSAATNLVPNAPMGIMPLGGVMQAAA